MISREKVISLAKSKIDDLNYFLVDVKISNNNQITILFDNQEGVVVDDCLLLSRHIEANLDREIEDYQLTVCSPGIDKSFIVRQQYLKYIGRDVKIKMISGEKIKGKLISFDKNIVVEKQKKKKKDLIAEKVIIPFKEVKETKLIIKFK